MPSISTFITPLPTVPHHYLPHHYLPHHYLLHHYLLHHYLPHHYLLHHYPTTPLPTTPLPTTPLPTTPLPTTTPTAGVSPTTPPTAGVLPATPPTAGVLPTTPPTAGVLHTTPPTAGVSPTAPPTAGVSPTTLATAGALPTTLSPTTMYTQRPIFKPGDCNFVRYSSWNQQPWVSFVVIVDFHFHLLLFHYTKVSAEARSFKKTLNDTGVPNRNPFHLQVSLRISRLSIWRHSGILQVRWVERSLAT